MEDNLYGQYNCCICKDQIVIPVEIICLPCYQENYIHCNSLIRICMLCAIHYFQLHKSILKRNYSVKCLFCPHRIRLSKIRLNNCFRIDFLMTTFLSNQYERSFSQTLLWTCPFCYQYSNGTIEVIRHIFEECSLFYYECQCGETIHRQEINSHRLTCSFYERCLYCFESIEKHTLNCHMERIHQRMACLNCHLYIHNDEIEDHHKEYCLFREIRCTICQESIRVIEIENHMEQHRISIETQLLHFKTEQEKMVIQLEEIFKLLKKYNTRPIRYLTN